MTSVEFHFVLPTGVPLVNSEVEIQLARSAFKNIRSGIALPRQVTLQTDFEGKATLGLWPSTTLYYVSVQDSASEAYLSYKFLVPEAPDGTVLRLQDIVVDAPMSGVTYDNAALLVIQDAKANSRASELAAAASAVSAAASAASRGTYRGPKATEAAMFTITSPVIGDKVKRTDLSGQVFELIALPATTLINWLDYPIGTISASTYADDYATDYA